jgi:hypothetical protein
MPVQAKAEDLDCAHSRGGSAMMTILLKQPSAASRRIRSGSRAKALHTLLAIAFGLVLAGCGGSTPQPKPPSAAFKIEKVNVAKLPPVNDRLPPLDDGRVEIAMPADWKAGERVKGRLAWAFMKSGRPYPAIIVTAADADDVQTLTPQEIQGFESQVQEEQDAEGVQLIQKVHAIQVGDFLGVEYIRRAKTDTGKTVDRLILETTSGGRRYRIEMQTLMGTTLESRPIALSVANSLKFLTAPEGSPEVK